MAWGIFKKIGQGLKKGFNWVKDHIIKPVAKVAAPIAKVAAPIVGTIIPGADKVLNAGADIVSKLSGANSIGGSNMVGANGHGIRIPPDKIMSRRIQLR